MSPSISRKDVFVQLAIAFAQVSFGIACGTIFSYSIDVYKLITICVNIVLTGLCIGICLLIVKVK